MKIQVSFDMLDLEKACSIAQSIEPYADIFEIGTVLIMQHGVTAIKRFRELFPSKQLLVDTKIVDRGTTIADLFAKAGADWVTIMAGTGKEVIQSSCFTAHNARIRIMLDLLDSSSVGQSALDAKNIGADALLFHQAHDEDESPLSLLDRWDSVRGNTSLPIFVSAKITRANYAAICSLHPDGIIIGHGIIEAENPTQEAAFFYEQAHKNH